MEIKLNITAAAIDQLDWEQWERIEEGMTFRQGREIIALFVVDENGEAMSYPEAFELLGKAKGPEMRLITDAFRKKIKELQAAAVPPQTSSS